MTALVEVEQNFLKPGRYRVGGRMEDLTAADLAEFASDTNKMLAAGLHVPVLSKHAPPGAVGPQLSSDGADAFDGKGWLKEVKVNGDGSITHRLAVTPDTQVGIKRGTIKFTSPELSLRDRFVDGKGRDHGRVIRHVALTPTPRNPDQGPFTEVDGQLAVAQFSLDDYEGPAQFMDDDTPEEVNQTEDVANNPDMPPKQRDPKADAIVAQLADLGVEVPADFDLGAEGAYDILLAALKTKSAAERKSAEEKETEPPESETEQMTQFSEDDLKAMSPMERKLAVMVNSQAKRIEEQDSKLAQFSEETATSKSQVRRSSAEAAIEKAKITPAAKTVLREKFLGDTVQFSEDADLLRVSDAIEIAEAACPPELLQFDLGDLRSEDNPNETTSGDAQSDADEQLRAVGFRGVPEKATA